MSDTLLLLAHPRLEDSRVSRTLLEAAQRLVQQGASLAVRDLYALYPEYLIDVAAEQAALAAAQRVVWLHPLHWYGVTPMLKLWQDEVLAFGWAYGGGNALQGKQLWLVTSTGGGPESYQPDGHNRHAFDDFLPPYTQTAALCGMHWLPPLVLQGAHRASAAELAGFTARFEQGLCGPADTAAGAGVLPVPDCTVPDDARPAGDAAPRQPG